MKHIRAVHVELVIYHALFVAAHPYADHDRVQFALGELIDCGILVRNPTTDNKHAVTEKGRAWIAALVATSFPTHRWVDEKGEWLTTDCRVEEIDGAPLYNVVAPPPYVGAPPSPQG